MVSLNQSTPWLLIIKKNIEILIGGKMFKTMIRPLESQLQLNIKMCLPVKKNIHFSSFDCSNIKNQIATYAK